MTIPNYPACETFVLAQEGNYVVDDGGPTNQGITLTTLRRYFRNATVASLKAITPATVSYIYKEGYWVEVNGDELPSGIDLMVFDSAINIGPGKATRQLQAAVGVEQDGVVGDETLKAIATVSPTELITRLSGMQKAYYQALADFGMYGAGWLARLERRTVAGIGMVGKGGA